MSIDRHFPAVLSQALAARRLGVRSLASILPIALRPHERRQPRQTVPAPGRVLRFLLSNGVIDAPFRVSMPNAALAVFSFSSGAEMSQNRRTKSLRLAIRVTAVSEFGRKPLMDYRLARKCRV